ncbi:hypothetical protein [Grimontia sp. SpTr1]|nr:hypothetical protein [Grimontia sp. SpTr1]
MSLSEEELVSEFAKHKELVIDCASGALEFWDFVESYNNFTIFVR